MPKLKPGHIKYTPKSKNQYEAHMAALTKRFAKKEAKKEVKKEVKKEHKRNHRKRKPRGQKNSDKTLSIAQSGAKRACMLWKKHMSNPFLSDPVPLGDAPNITNLGMAYYRAILSGTGTEKNYLIAAMPNAYCRDVAVTNTCPIAIWQFSAGPNWTLVNYYNWQNATNNKTLYAATRPISLAIRVHIRTALSVKPPMLMGGLMPPGTGGTVEGILGTPTGYNVSTVKGWVTTKETDSLCFASSWIPLTMDEIELFQNGATPPLFTTPVPYVLIQDIDPAGANATVEVEIISFFEGQPNSGGLAYGARRRGVKYTVMETWNHYVASGKKDFALDTHSNMISKHSFLYGGSANLSDIGSTTSGNIVDNPYNEDDSYNDEKTPLDKELEAQSPNPPLIHREKGLYNQIENPFSAKNNQDLLGLLHAFGHPIETAQNIYQGFKDLYHDRTKPRWKTHTQMITDLVKFSKQYKQTPGDIVNDYINENKSDIDSDFETTTPNLDREDHPLSKSTIDLAMKIKELNLNSTKKS